MIKIILIATKRKHALCVVYIGAVHSLLYSVHIRAMTKVGEAAIVSTISKDVHLSWSAISIIKQKKNIVSMPVPVIETILYFISFTGF